MKARKPREIWIIEIDLGKGWFATIARSYQSKWYAQRGQGIWREQGISTRVRKYTPELGLMGL